MGHARHFFFRKIYFIKGKLKIWLVSENGKIYYFFGRYIASYLILTPSILNGYPCNCDSIHPRMVFESFLHLEKNFKKTLSKLCHKQRLGFYRKNSHYWIVNHSIFVCKTPTVSIEPWKTKLQTWKFCMELLSYVGPHGFLVFEPQNPEIGYIIIGNLTKLLNMGNFVVFLLCLASLGLFGLLFLPLPGR